VPRFTLKRLVATDEVYVIVYDDTGKVIGLRGPLDEEETRDERFVPHEGVFDPVEDAWVKDREWEDV